MFIRLMYENNMVCVGWYITEIPGRIEKAKTSLMNEEEQREIGVQLKPREQ